MPLWFLRNLRSPFLGYKGCSRCVWFTDCIAETKMYIVIFFVFYTSGGISSEATTFLFLFFFSVLRQVPLPNNNNDDNNNNDPLGNVQGIKIWPCQRMVHAQSSTCPRKWNIWIPMGLWHTNGSPNFGQKTRPYNNQQQKKKKRICIIVDLAVPVDHRIKLKGCEKRDKYLDLARELKKLWNMKVTIIPIVIGAFGTVTKGLLKSLEDLEVGGRVETIQTTALLKTARILRRVLETWRDLLSLNL